MQDVLLEVRNLKKRYGDNAVLHDVSFEVRRGEVVVIIGPSGCGKSTLLRCMNGLETIESGEIHYMGENIVKKETDWSLIRQKIGMVFQSYDLFPHMTILQNLMLGPLKVKKLKKAEVLPQAEALLERVGLLEKRDAYPRELSGGQKQRAAIARALMMNPEILLFDEVTAALDPEMVREVLNVMLELAKNGSTMLIVTHEMQFAKAVADKVMLMDEGNIIETAAPDAFFESPQTERGKSFLNIFTFE